MNELYCGEVMNQKNEEEWNIRRERERTLAELRRNEVENESSDEESSHSILSYAIPVITGAVTFAGLYFSGI